MPCRDYGNDLYDGSYEITQLKERNDLLARVACRAHAALEKVDPANKVLKIKENREWWAEHKAADAVAAKERAAARKEREKKAADKKLKMVVLKKLSVKERRVLGIK